MQTFQILFFYKRYCFINKLFLYLPSSNRTIIGDSEFQSFIEQSFKWPPKLVEVWVLGVFFANKESDFVKIREVLPEKRRWCQLHIMWGMQERVLILALNSSLPRNLSSTYSGVWLIKCRQGSKTNITICQFWKKLKFD
jgi:hypothetical protein